VIDPVPEEEIKLLMKSVSYTNPYSRPGEKTCVNKLPEAERNTCILLYFPDNGVRVSELCDLKIKDIDLKQKRAFILGKGNKVRFVPFSDKTGHAIWDYHSKREYLYPDDYVFSTDRNRKLESRYVQKMLERASQRAGISHIHPHRLRHTFAITYLSASG